jgi:hypothetical protein
MSLYQISDGSSSGIVFPAGTPVGFYGATPVSARTSTASFHSTSWVSVSSNITVGSALAAWATEVTATLVGLGLWT